MRRPELRFRLRHLLIGVALAAAGLLLLRATSGGDEEVLVRQYPKDGRAWNRGREVHLRLRLDPDRLRARGLSKDDVMNALAESRMIDPSDPKRADPPPGVVFVTRLPRPGQLENTVLKANADGEVVRIKDIAKVEVGR